MEDKGTHQTLKETQQPPRTSSQQEGNKVTARRKARKPTPTKNSDSKAHTQEERGRTQQGQALR